MENIIPLISDIYQIISFIVLIVSVVYIIEERQRVPEGQIVQDPLTGKDKKSIWILSLLNPIVAGVVFYYGLRKRLPVKAKEANQISYSAFGLEFLLCVVLGIALFIFNPTLLEILG